jgi:predicted MFS family arabinose efflux permease
VFPAVVLLDHSQSTARRGHAAAKATLFLCLFASQASLIALGPVLVEVAADLGVSTAAAGQLRTISGLAAGITAFLLPAAARRLGLGRLLTGAAVLLAIASATSAAAPSFATLAAAQVLVGVGVASLVTAGTAAAAEWLPPEERARALSWALIGNPAAWIVGMPAIGLVGEHSWRWAWLALPLPAAALAAFAVARRPQTAARPAAPRGRLRGALANTRTRRWLTGELLANSAWVGLLVYAGAVFTESYGISTATTGVLLALAAAAFVAGNLSFRRLADRELRRPLAALALGMAAVVPLIGAVRPAPAVSAALLSAAAFLAGGRTLLGNAYGLQVPAEERVAVMAARAAANQLGYFVGAAAGGLALAVAGYAGLGVVLGLLLVAAAASVAAPRRRKAGIGGCPEPVATG